MDENGRISFNQAAYIHASLSGPTSAQLKGNIYADIVDGLATFTDLSITEDGQGFVLKLSAPSLGKYIETPRFSVLPPVRNLLVANSLPSIVRAGHSIGTFDAQTGAPILVPSAYLLDEDRHYAALSGRLVSVSAIGPVGGELRGQTQVYASSGVASFHSVYLTKMGNYSLVFTSGDARVVSSSVITVVAGRPAFLSVDQQPCAVPCDGLAPSSRSQVCNVYLPICTHFCLSISHCELALCDSPALRTYSQMCIACVCVCV
jgi:hypothetical protein